jgi:hypothetical protein
MPQLACQPDLIAPDQQLLEDGIAQRLELRILLEYAERPGAEFQISLVKAAVSVCC